MKKVFLFALILFLAGFLEVSMVEAATYFVDYESGVDAPNGGGATHPWRTPWYADDMISEGDSVVILPRVGNQSYATSTFGSCQAVLDIQTPNTTWMATTTMFSEVISERLASTTIYIASGTQMIATTSWYIATSSVEVSEPVAGRAIFSQTGDTDTNPYCFCGGVASSSCEHNYMVSGGEGQVTVNIGASGVKLQGFTIWGSVHVASTADDVVIEDCDLSGGNDMSGYPAVLRIGAENGHIAYPSDFTENLLLKNNYFHDNRDAFNAGRDYNGLVLITGGRDIRFENNEFNNARYAEVLWRGRYNQIVWQQNYFHDAIAALRGDGYNGADWFDIAGNIFDDIKEDAIYFSGGNLTNLYIRNNLFYNNGTDISWHMAGGAQVNIFNNIHYRDSSTGYLVDSASYHSINEQWSSQFYNYLDYNQYYSNGLSSYFFTNYHRQSDSLLGWQNFLLAQGASVDNSESHSLALDPDFVGASANATAVDYYKRIAYPALGRGGHWPQVIGPYITGTEIIGRGTNLNTTAPLCGDGLCSLRENCNLCADDCGMCSDNIAPSSIRDLQIESSGYSFATLRWQAVGDDLFGGQATSYDIRYSSQSINEANWATATEVNGEPAPARSEQMEEYSLIGLFPNSHYYIAIKTGDEADNWSPISNVVSVFTASSSLNTIIDNSPPAIPTDFTVEPARGQARLSWHNPVDDDFVRVRVRRTFRHVHDDDIYTKSEIVYEGDDESFVDIDLLTDLEYTYTIQSYDRVPNYSDFASLSVVPANGEVFVNNSNINLYPGDAELTSLARVNSATVERMSAYEADIIFSYNQFVNLNAGEVTLYQNLIALSANAPSQNNAYSLAYFIHTGSQTTVRLGAGERAGVLHSYFQAFNRFPDSTAQWQDIIKIASGRWPGERNNISEENTRNNIFPIIYLRSPKPGNINDLSAVLLITYGLLPAERNFDSEDVAISIFTNIYGHSPANALEWNIMRAIAYSGAIR